MEMSSNNESDLPCTPASPRRCQVPGPDSVKSATEDYTGVADQASVSVNATGTSKKLVQQAFHRGLFVTRPRSSSLGNISTCEGSENSILTVDPNTKNNADQTKGQLPPSWQRLPARNPKRKKLSKSPPTSETEDINNVGLGTSNRFSGLPIDLTADEPMSEIEYPKKVIKPPPIILYGIDDVSKLSELLNSAIPSDSYTYKVINRNQLRITTQDTEVYKKVIELMRQNNLIGHTFTQKQNKCYRIVVKNLHHTTPIEAIVEEIEKSGNTVRGEVICAKSRKNKMPLNMFFVNLEPSENNIKVKEIEVIYNTKVKIEDPRKTNEIPQCTRCQQYGHTKNNCMRPFRCVKCAQGHRTTDCPKRDRNSPATCTLCLGSHPANYKGCQVYKEIRARKLSGYKRDTNYKEIKNTTTQRPFTSGDFPVLRTNEAYSRQNSTVDKSHNKQNPTANKTDKRQITTADWETKSQNSIADKIKTNTRQNSITDRTLKRQNSTTDKTANKQNSKFEKTSTGQNSTANDKRYPPHRPESIETGHWTYQKQSIQAQSTNLLEQIIIRQSEKIDILIQQLGTLMGLLTTLIAQYNQRNS